MIEWQTLSSPEERVSWLIKEFTPIKCFVGNLLNLGLDRRPTWPSITVEIYEAEDTPENKQIRIRCTEWALFHLIMLWDENKTAEVGFMF